MLRALLIVVALLLGTGAAHAQEVRVDWQSGLLIAQGAAVGDLRAPTRALARIKAERRARERAVAKLWAAAKGLDVAGKTTLAAVPGFDQQSAEASLGTLTLAVDYGSEGSVVVELAMPIDGLRSVAFQADAPLRDPSKGPRAVLVDATSLKLRPALGIAVGNGSKQYRGPTVFFSGEKDARKDSRIGAGPKLIKAQAYRDGVLMLEGESDLEALRASGSLVGIIWSVRHD